MKIHLDRLRDRYGYKNEKYRELIKKILAQNVSMVNNRIGDLSAKHWRKQSDKIPVYKKQIVLPKFSDVIPRRSIQTLKSAQNGELITDTLRDALTKKLRARVKKYAKKPTARINNELVKKFEEDIQSVYRGYTKRPKKGFMPPNIEAIARTEVRSAIGIVKKTYVAKLQQKNPDMQVTKRWIHHKSLSKNPRPGHIVLNNSVKKLTEPFIVHQYVYKKGRWLRTGKTIRMMHPHDPTAPAGEIINCSCDCIYSTRMK